MWREESRQNSPTAQFAWGQMSRLNRRADGMWRGGDHTFIDQNQAEVISGGVFLVDFSEGWCQVEAAEEQTDRYRFTS